MFEQIKKCLLPALCVSLMFCGCGRKGADSITVAGSTAFQPFAEKLAVQFMAQRGDIRVAVQGGGSALGIESVRSGAAQVGMADLVALPPEAKELSSVIVARDGIAVIVHPGNKISALSTEQLRRILNGLTKNWKELGGDDHPVRIVSREAGSGTRSSFEQIIGSVNLIADAVIQNSSGTVRETVANDKDTIGYLSHGVLNQKVKAIQVDGVNCTKEEIVSGRYRLVRPVFFLTRGDQSAAVQAFIDYVLSPEGQETIMKEGLLPAR